MKQKQGKEAAPESPLGLPDPDQVQQRFEIALEKIRARKGFYTTLGVLALLAVLGALVYANLSTEQETSRFVEVFSRWRNVREKLAVNKSAHQELVELEALLEDLRGAGQEGNALWFLGVGHYREAWTDDKASFEQRKAHLEKAALYLERLQAERFDELLLAKSHWFTSSTQTPVGELLRQVKADLAWETDRAYKEPLPDARTVAVLRTSAGDLHLQFFADLAPEHARNFLTLATLGTYNETYFHFIRRDPVSDKATGVMGGDPYTFFYNDPLKKKHILRWGSGGVGYDLPPEPSRFRINHLRGVVTSQMREKADWDNGSQFMILLDADRDLDRRHTPFAKVVEGLGIADKIAERKTASAHGPYKDDYGFTAAATRDLVVEPVILHKVVVFEEGRAVPHSFPLEESEKNLATLSQTPVKPLEGEALFAGRRLRKVDAPGDVRLGLDVPYPDDVGEEKPEGERVARADLPK